jgi:hypothetical protein
MAAGQGFKTFTTGEVLTAGDVNGYLMQGINVFASNAARDAAITSPQEGQFAYTKDTNSLWYYTGSAWAASGATGDIEGVTAGVGISGGGTSGTVTITNSMATEIAAKGDLIAGTGSQTFDNLTVGANNSVLTADSSTATGLKWATPSSGALTLISTTTFSAVSTQTFNSVFSSTYRNYKIIMSVRGTSDPYTLNFYYRASGTNNTSANYNWGQYNATRGGTLAIGSYGSDVANMPLGPSSAPTGSTVAFNVDATVFQPFGLGQRQTIHLSYTNSTNGGHGWSALQGYENTTYDGFAITPSAGTISGTVSVYGIGN